MASLQVIVWIVIDLHKSFPMVESEVIPRRRTNEGYTMTITSRVRYHIGFPTRKMGPPQVKS